MKRVAIYARVSTDKQTCENQLIELRAVAERCGYTIVTEFVDTGISGAKGRADRPDLPPFAIPLISWKSRLRLI